MEVIEAIKGRRSVRRYQSTPVDEKTLETVLEAARWAPSWANTQCWRFVVVREKSVRAELAETLRDTETGDTPVKNPAFRAMQDAPVVIVGCAQLDRSGFKPGGPATDKGGYWYMYDVALAMQNLMLAAHSLGLGTVQVGMFDAGKAAAILGVPEGFCVVAMTPLGYPERESRTPPRKELSEIVFHNKFGV